MLNLSGQKPATKNQITSSKPNVIKDANVLQGFICNSINGGMVKPIAYKQVMAGTKDYEYRLQMNLKMLTPKTPAYQKLYGTIKTYFVPNSRVMDEYERFIAQKADNFGNKINELPNFGGFYIPMVETEVMEDNLPIEYINYMDTVAWRDSAYSIYMPRFETGLQSMEQMPVYLPKYSSLPFRGWKAIWNDFERNKQYDKPLQEYKGNTMTQNEFNTYFPKSILNIYENESNSTSYTIFRGKRANSYYTDYRTDLLGEELTENQNINSTNELLNLVESQKYIAEARSQAENIELNDWDIMAKIRGAKKATQGKVQLLSTKTFGINYQAVTQDTYNLNDNVTEEFQTLGQQGAYVYTEIDLPLYQMQEFIEDGYVHVVLQITADTVFETGFERTGLNVGALDQYRPDLKELKHDVLYNIEKNGTRLTENEELTEITGFKRKFSEYFKSPNCLAGEMTNRKFWEIQFVGLTPTNLNITGGETKIENQKTFQFFEETDKLAIGVNGTGRTYPKKIWKDYTDIEISRNQAIEDEIDFIEHTSIGIKGDIRVKGQNQIFFIGMQTSISDLPIDESIKTNFTKWGEV